MAENLSRNGHVVNVCCAVPNYPAGDFLDGYSNTARREDQFGDVKIRRAWTIPRGKSKLTLLLNYLAFPLASSIAILTRKQRPDVVFVSQLSPVFMVIPGIVQKWKTGSGLVYWVQDIWPESATITLGIRSKIFTAILNAICGWLYRRADIVLVQSAGFIEMIARFGVPRERIRVLSNTAPALYRPLAPQDAPEHAAAIPQEGFRLMFAGNIGESQDFDTLVAAAALLSDRKDLHWIVVGSGRDEERVRGLVREKGLEDNIRFLGRYPEEAMPALFAHADAMLVSLKDTPIFALTVPYKTQCYMACGKPIVASLNGEGARIVTEAKAGISVPAGRPGELADAVVRIMNSTPDERAAYASNSRRYFEENYASAKVYGDLERALEDAASGRPRS
ncbi:glycosyltransferase family 4 protein [Shinella sp. S4-D37]